MLAPVTTQSMNMLQLVNKTDCVSRYCSPPNTGWDSVTVEKEGLFIEGGYLPLVLYVLIPIDRLGHFALFAGAGASHDRLHCKFAV